jgi:hypothetical protein
MFRVGNHLYYCCVYLKCISTIDKVVTHEFIHSKVWFLSPAIFTEFWCHWPHLPRILCLQPTISCLSFYSTGNNNNRKRITRERNQFACFFNHTNGSNLKPQITWLKTIMSTSEALYFFTACHKGTHQVNKCETAVHTNHFVPN